MSAYRAWHKGLHMYMHGADFEATAAAINIWIPLGFLRQSKLCRDLGCITCARILTLQLNYSCLGQCSWPTV